MRGVRKNRTGRTGEDARPERQPGAIAQPSGACASSPVALRAKHTAARKNRQGQREWHRQQPRSRFTWAGAWFAATCKRHALRPHDVQRLGRSVRSRLRSTAATTSLICTRLQHLPPITEHRDQRPCRHAHEQCGTLAARPVHQRRPQNETCPDPVRLAQAVIGGAFAQGGKRKSCTVCTSADICTTFAKAAQARTMPWVPARARR